MNPKYRMNRFFRSNGRSIMVAMDHGAHNVFTLLDGLEDFETALASVVAGSPDAVLLAPGQAPLLQAISPRGPSLVLRSDVTNVYAAPRLRHEYCRLVPRAVETALRLDACAVLLNLYHCPGNSVLHEQCVRNILAVKPACDRFGMPLIVEPLILEGDDSGQGYRMGGKVEEVIALHRQAVELGADVLKSDPTEDVDRYGEVVRAVGKIPLLPRGGGRVSSREILERTSRMISAGAAGIVYGRNIFQSGNVPAMLQAVTEVVHQEGDVESALARLHSPAELYNDR